MWLNNVVVGVIYGGVFVVLVESLVILLLVVIMGVFLVVLVQVVVVVGQVVVEVVVGDGMCFVYQGVQVGLIGVGQLMLVGENFGNQFSMFMQLMQVVM